MDVEQIYTAGNSQVSWIFKIKQFIFPTLKVTALHFVKIGFITFIFLPWLSASQIHQMGFAQTLTISAAAVVYGLAASFMSPPLSLSPATPYCKPEIAGQ